MYSNEIFKLRYGPLEKWLAGGGGGGGLFSKLKINFFRQEIINK